MFLNKITVAAAIAAVVLGALMISPASAASKWSDISSVTNRGTQEVHPKAGGPEEYSRTDLTAVTHKGVGGQAKQIGRVTAANYRGSDVTAVTHHN